MKSLLFFGLFLCSLNFAFGQDTTLIQEVEVISNALWSRDSISFVPTLSRKKIEQIQAEDIGQLLQLFAGAQIKSYGGLGGLKTVSIRGLGGQHTSFVVNGVVAPPDQTGQVNFGAIQSDNVEQLSLNYADHELLPASAISFGSVISMETFEGKFSPAAHSFRISQKYGSFGQVDSHLAYKKGDERNRYFIAVSGKYRSAGGKYPFVLENGDSIYRGIRENNHYQDIHLNIGTGYRFKKGAQLKANYQGFWVQQELPGPVVLYTPAGNQDLLQQNNQVQWSYDFKMDAHTPTKIFGMFKSSNLQYTDSNYLNSQGLLKSDFQLRMLDLGITTRFFSWKKVVVTLSGEGQLWGLSSSNYNENSPLRMHMYVVPNVQFKLGKYLLMDAQGSLQSMIEERPTQRNWYAVNPFVQLKTKPLWKNRIAAYFYYRNSLRMPSFNELYYNKIGNLDLLPERAHQLALGAEFCTSSKTFAHLMRLNVYYNKVLDKIVAVPTMNLFQWTIQNIGIVDVLGFDMYYSVGWNLAKEQKIDFGLTYNFQSVKDKTDNNSPTYNNQIAYMPVHSGNIDLVYAFKNYSARFALFASDKRYSLNENIASNKVNGFLVVDLSVHAFWKIKEKSKINLSFSCKNLFNKSYAIVRNYVMPGRNYLISINYAFN